MKRIKFLFIISFLFCASGAFAQQAETAIAPPPSPPEMPALPPPPPPPPSYLAAPLPITAPLKKVKAQTKQVKPVESVKP